MKHLTILITAALAWGTLPFALAAGWDELPSSASSIKESAAGIALPAPAPERALPLICVDPGHPNSFSAGTTMINGTNEARINWQVSVRLERILKEKGFEVLMTRSSETQSVENKDRALLCNAASLAVHLHCESTPGSGFALYYPDRQGTYDYKDDPDNGFKGPSRQVMTDSLVLAQAMQTSMRTGLAGSLADLGVKGDSRTQVGESQGALTFSIFSKIPTLTIEMVVLTNKRDAAFIKSVEGQEKMAQAIAAGIQLHQAR
jgi:N-acetylmuramoyl-L-alanine amidase